MLLYKYLRPYNKLNGDDIIVEDLFGRLLIRFTQPKKLFFNDPFDFRPEIRGYENPNYVKHELVKAKANLQKKGVINTDNLPLEEKILYEGRMNDLQKKRVQNITSEADKWEDEHLDSLFQKMGKEIGVLCLCEQPDNIRIRVKNFFASPRLPPSLHFGATRCMISPRAKARQKSWQLFRRDD